MRWGTATGQSSDDHFEPGANGWSSTLQKRSTAVVVIYSAAVLHITEALIVANTTAADNSIPIASLLAALRGHRVSLDIIMVIAAL